MIGAIGSKTLDDVIMFEASDEKVLTFKNFVRNNKARYAKHDVLLNKPVAQFIGPELDVITLDIILKTEFGVDPREEMDKLMYLQRDGKTISIIIGGSGFGYYRWTIQDCNMTWKVIDAKGVLIDAGCALTLQEYV